MHVTMKKKIFTQKRWKLEFDKIKFIKCSKVYDFQEQQQCKKLRRFKFHQIKIIKF